MAILRAAREVGLPQWYVGAGAIRNVVWDYLHGYSGRTTIRDVDLVYFDSTDLSGSIGKQAEITLSALVPEVEWDVVNQAGVHLWYEDMFGIAAEPVQSCEQGIDTWPETATCVAARLLEDDQLHLYASYGLEDLFGLVLCRNKRRVTPELFRQRYIEKRIKERWPSVTIIED